MMDLGIDLTDRLQSSVTDQVFDALYHAVISVKLPPGTKISEGDIAKQLGVSRQPVRDAFFRLSNLGFIAIRPQRATLVTQISLRKVDDAVFIRAALETDCLRTAMAISGDRLCTALQDCLHQHRATIDADAALFHQRDEEFHELICDIAGHAHVWTLIREQKAHLDRIRYLSLSGARRQVVLDEHQTIVSAIRRNDADKATATLRKHIQGVHSIAADVQANYPAYFGDN